MSRWYLDTSAAMKLIAREPESDALASRVGTDRPELVGCLLLETELRRAAHRVRGLTQQHVSTLLEAIELYEVEPSVFSEAGLLPGTGLRSPDALHLAAALRIGVEHVVTYDARMTSAAVELGMSVIAPS